MLDDSLKKINRIIAILTSLQSKKIVKAQDLADRFGVSLRTIYRDVKTLESAGVPILSEAGVGYSIMEGYRLPPVSFTREEAGSLITGEKLMRTFSDKGLGDHFQSAITKIKSVLKTYEKDWIDSFEDQIYVNAPKELFNSEIHNSLEVIIKSIAAKQAIILEYKAQYKDPSNRQIEPVGIFHQNGYWYILGYCLLRHDYRQFRTDRIQSISNTSHSFTKTHGKLSDHFSNYSDHKEKITVKILADKSIAKYIVNSKYNYGFVQEEETPEGILMTFNTIEIQEGFPRWYLSYGDYMQIIEPEELKENVREILRNIQVK